MLNTSKALLSSFILLSTACDVLEQQSNPGRIIFAVVDTDVISVEENFGTTIVPIELLFLSEAGEVESIQLNAATNTDGVSGCFADCSCTQGSAYTPFKGIRGAEYIWGDYDFSVANQEVVFASGSFTLSKNSCDSYLITADNPVPIDEYDGPLKPWMSGG